MTRGQWELSDDKQHRFRLTSYEASSRKYVPCEVCGKHVDEVFSQTHEVRYDQGWTQHQAHRSGIGHAECLRRIRNDDQTTNAHRRAKIHGAAR